MIAVPRKTRPPQSPPTGVAEFEVKTIGASAVPLASSMPVLSTTSAEPGRPLIVVPGSMVSVAPVTNTWVSGASL